MKNDDIARRVREIRKERGLTQKDIAEFLNKTAATISDMERGKIQFSASDLYTISKVLNKPIEYFYGEEYDENEINDLISLIRKQSQETRNSVIRQTKMLLSMQAIKDKSESKNQELSNEEIKETVVNIFSFADEIETIYKTMLSVRKNLKESLKNQGFDESDFLKPNN